MPNKNTMKKGLQTRISYVNLTLENLMAERREHDMKIVGERMKKLREEAGISQNKLAKLIGIQQSSLNRYENNQTAVPSDLLLRYADYFDVSLDYIFGRTDRPQGKLYKFKPRSTPEKEELRQFIEMCFDPKSPMNGKLKDTLFRLMEDEE
mgnify:CR=1 FL=1